jgi:hypothetical protein
MGNFLVPIKGSNETIPVEAGSRAEAIEKAKQILASRQPAQLDDYGRPLNVPAPPDENIIARYAKEFGKGAVSGLAAANPIDIGMNMQGYLADQIAKMAGVPRGADVRQKMQSGLQGWVERNVLPPPVEGYDTTRKVGNFVGAVAGPGALLRGAAVAPEVLAGARGAGEAASALGRGAVRDTITGTAASVAGETASSGLGHAGRFIGSQISPEAGRTYEALGELVGGLGGTFGGGALANRTINSAAQNTRRFPGSERNIDILRENDVPMTAGQELNNNSLRAAEDVAANLPGGSHAGDVMRSQTPALSRAFARLMGYDMQNPEVGLWTPEEWLGAKRMFREQYGDLTSRNNIHVDQDALSNFHRIYGAYTDDLGPMNTSRRDVVGNTYNDLVNGGMRTLPGQQYQQWRSDLTKRIQDNIDHRPTYNALRDMRQSLEDTMGRSLIGEDATAWNDLNRRYANYKTVQEAMAPAAGEAVNNFELSPARIRSKAAQKAPAPYLEGTSDVGNLARAADAILPRPKSSGTAERSLAQNLNLSGTGATVGAAIGNAVGGPVGGTAGGAILGALAPAIVNKFQGSEIGQRMARNSAAVRPIDGGPLFNQFQQYAPIVNAMPLPIELPTINVRGNQ